MIQVSIGSRSRSPFSPLSLRMIWRADLMMRSSRCATASGLAPAFFWIVSLGTCSLARTLHAAGAAHAVVPVELAPAARHRRQHFASPLPPFRRSLAASTKPPDFQIPLASPHSERPYAHCTPHETQPPGEMLHPSPRPEWLPALLHFMHPPTATATHAHLRRMTAAEPQRRLLLT